MRYSATWEETAGIPIAVLRDHQTNAELRIAPSLGNTCIAFRVGDWRVLDEPPNGTELLTRASSYGIPILFPWPNRLRDGRFRFEGREYRVPPSPGSPHANHGLVRNRPWKVKRCEATDTAAVLECEIASTDFPEIAEQFPSVFRLSVAYELRGIVLQELYIVARVTNLGEGRLPFGLGFHPYFSVPLGPDGQRELCELMVPADEYWELVGLLPTGRRQPVAGRLDLREFRALGDAEYDDLLHGTIVSTAATVQDLPSGRRIVIWAQRLLENGISAEGGFREVVVFAPGHRSIVAVEPYTCTTDALNLHARGVDTGLQILEPGATWSGLVEIEVDEFDL